MKLTIWYEKGKYRVSGYRFFASADKLYINDSFAKLEENEKIILDAWEINMRKIAREENSMGSWNYIVEEIDLYTMPYLIAQHLHEQFGDNPTFTVKVIRE